MSSVAASEMTPAMKDLVLPPRMRRMALAAAAWRTRSARPIRGSFIGRSESFELGKGEHAALDVHAAVLGAAVQRGDHLARIEQALRIERGLQREHLRTLGLGELHAHRVELLGADAVLAADRAAHRDAQLEDLRAEGLGAAQLVGVVGIEQD